MVILLVQMVQLVVLAAAVEIQLLEVLEILQVHLPFKDMLEVLVSIPHQLMAEEEAEVLLKLVKLVLLLKVAMVETELHLLYLVLQ